MEEFSGIKELEYLDGCLSGWHKAKAKEVIRLLEGRKLLDVGCGIGTFTKAFADSGFDVTGMDMSERCLNKARRINAAFFREDICSPDKLEKMHGRFDSVVALDVLEHIKDEHAALAGISNLLKPNGTFVLTVPAFSFLYSSYDKKIEHKRRYSAPGVRSLLGENGFRVEKVFYWNFPGIFGWLACKILNRNPVETTTNEKIDKFYRVWFKIEERVKPPFGLTIFAKARKI
jgi:SAM-dependent methyltransferase